MARVASLAPLAFDAVRRAIQLEQLEVHYQPQIDMRGGVVCGLEALVRWRDPIRGLVPTIEVVRLAESTGLISDLTEYVCRTALRQFGEWRRVGLAEGVRLAINISGADIRREFLLPMLRQHTEDAAVPISIVDLEITESAIMDSDATAAAALQELRRAGVRIAVDDFGTGHSSLARLQRLPVDVLKIDKAFIDEIVVAAKPTALASAIITMAHALGLVVVAEGVETVAQHDFLRTETCDIFQGHLASAALTASEAEHFFTGPYAIRKPGDGFQQTCE
jgi:EAL domain-containing protein (putative c-di-GMP-specific phosphodiesterase class I)